jgi:hypothetical protein
MIIIRMQQGGMLRRSSARVRGRVQVQLPVFALLILCQSICTVAFQFTAFLPKSCVINTQSLHLHLHHRVHQHVHQRVHQRRAFPSSVVTTTARQPHLNLNSEPLPYPALSIRSGSGVHVHLSMAPTETDFQEEDEDSYTNTNTNTSTSTREQLKEAPVSNLLSILKRYEIRIPPTASRDELIDLIIQYQGQGQRQSNNVNDIKDNRGEIGPDGNRDRGRQGENVQRSDAKRTRTRTRRRTNGGSSTNGNGDQTSTQRTRRPTTTTPTNAYAYSRREQRRQKSTSASASAWDETIEGLNSFIPVSVSVSASTAKEAKRLGLQAVDGVTNVAKSATDAVGRRIGNLNLKGNTSASRSASRSSSSSARRRRRRGRDGEIENFDVDVDGVQEVDWYYVSRDEEFERPSPRSRKKTVSTRPRSKPRPRPSSSSSSRAPPERKRPVKRKFYRDRDYGAATIPVRGRADPDPGPDPTRRKKKRLKKKKKRVVNVNRDMSQSQGVGGSDLGVGVGVGVVKKRELLALPPKLEHVVYVPNLNQDSNKEQRDLLQDVIYYPQDTNTNNEDVAPNSTSDRNGDAIDADACIEDDDDAKDEKQHPRSEPRKRSSPRSARQKRNSSNGTKKIYSVYPKDEEALDFEELYGSTAAGAIDTIGEFLADVAGGDYSRGRGTARTTGGINDTRRGEMHNETAASTARDHPRRDKKQRSGRRYWKDRLAERVDYALGVHEDGKYYQSWQNQLDRQKAREVDGKNDPISIFYDKQKKRLGREHDAPFWEQDGNLVSVLFGRPPSGKELTFNVRTVNSIWLEKSTQACKGQMYIS